MTEQSLIHFKVHLSKLDKKWKIYKQQNNVLALLETIYT